MDLEHVHAVILIQQCLDCRVRAHFFLQTIKARLDLARAVVHRRSRIESVLRLHHILFYQCRSELGHGRAFRHLHQLGGTVAGSFIIGGGIAESESDVDKGAKDDDDGRNDNGNAALAALDVFRLHRSAEAFLVTAHVF